jgi:hypothetical protein
VVAACTPTDACLRSVRLRIAGVFAPLTTKVSVVVI